MAETTHTSQIMTALNEAPRGLTANELHEKLRIAKNTLGTTIWQLKKDGYLSRVGGARGSYKYGLTPKGRDWFEQDVDPLSRLTRAMTGDSANFTEMLQVIESLDEYKTLRSYVGWLNSEYPEYLADDVPNLGRRLNESVLKYLGVDVTAFTEQRQSLESLLGVLELA